MVVGRGLPLGASHGATPLSGSEKSGLMRDATANAGQGEGRIHRISRSLANE